MAIAFVPGPHPSWDLACLGPYKVLGTIAEGGMGIVLRGQDVRNGQMVALKTARARRRSDETAIRREISVLGQLSHPGIVRVIADGQCGGAPWMAMELLHGVTLCDQIAALWRTAALPPAAAAGQLPAALRVAAQLCRALGYLHARGLVHRDVKPANVFLGDGGRVTLLDFGLVCVTRDGATELRAAEICVGTMEYAAPEQLRGEPVDARADIYSAGCVLYELLTGRRLDDADAGDAIGPGQRPFLPTPPSLRVSDVPPELDALVLKMLADRREARPASAGAIADMLDRIALRAGGCG